MNKELTIIIVLYNCTDIIFECLKSLKNFNIIIVDNTKNDNLLKKLNNYQNIKKITGVKKNLGFGNGVNLGFNHVKTEHFLVLNPDIIIDEISINELIKISKKILIVQFQLHTFLPMRVDIQCFQKMGKV